MKIIIRCKIPKTSSKLDLISEISREKPSKMREKKLKITVKVLIVFYSTKQKVLKLKKKEHLSMFLFSF